MTDPSPAGAEGASAEFLTSLLTVEAPLPPAASLPSHQIRLTALSLLPAVARAMPNTPGPDTAPALIRSDAERALKTVLAANKSITAPYAELLAVLLDEMLGLGPLEVLRRDPAVTDILVNKFDEVYVERNGRLEPAEVAFINDDHFMALVHRLIGRAGRRVDQASPIADALLPDGSRLNVILPPLSVNGPSLSLRRHATNNLSLPQLVSAGSVPQRAAALLILAIRGRLNILLTGGAGAGKTTLLNAMSAYIAPGERIVTVEDVAELQMRQRHVVRLQTRPANLEGTGEITLRDLVRQTLRMRSDRVIVGEVRGPEAWDMLTAMNTGAQGSLGTLHANQPVDAILRLEGLVALANPSLGLRAIRSNLASALDLVVHVARFADGVRRITDIDEVGAVDDEGVTLRPIYRYRGGRAGASSAGDQDEFFDLSDRLRRAASTLGLDDLLAAFSSQRSA